MTYDRESSRKCVCTQFYKPDYLCVPFPVFVCARSLDSVLCFMTEAPGLQSLFAASISSVQCSDNTTCAILGGCERGCASVLFTGFID